MNEKREIMRLMAAAILMVSAVLAGCGGGGGDAGCTRFGGTGCESSSGSGGGSSGSGTSASQSEPAALVFDSALPADKSIVLKGAGGTGRTETAVLKFRVVGVDGKPVVGQQVVFSVVSTKAVTLNTTQAVSDADGMVMTSVNSGVEPTTFRVKAALGNTMMSTMSDTVMVTTGQPVAMAMSLSADTFNIEGWDSDDVRTAVNVLIADQFGNPVADGMPVVFQTDNGAIASSAQGGCTTVNGKCSVEFRSQNPRTVLGEAGKRGVATITASLTSGSETLTRKIFVTMSGSIPDALLLFEALPPERSMDDCETERVLLKLADENGNPLPSKTTVSVIEASNLDVKIIGPDVPNLRGINGFTRHMLEITPQNCMKSDAIGSRKTVEGKFGVSVKTPGGIETMYYAPFKRTYLVVNSQ